MRIRHALGRIRKDELILYFSPSSLEHLLLISHHLKSLVAFKKQLKLRGFSFGRGFDEAVMPGYRLGMTPRKARDKNENHRCRVPHNVIVSGQRFVKVKSFTKSYVASSGGTLNLFQNQPL